MHRNAAGRRNSDGPLKLVAENGPTSTVVNAADGLAQRFPAASAKSGLWLWQALALATLVGVFAGGFVIVPDAALIATAIAMTLPFLAITLLRLAALLRLLFVRLATAHASGNGDADLPVYSLLCPLYREAPVVAQLIDALSRLDYPTDRLDIILIVEASDAATREAIGQCKLADQFNVVVVPEGTPRTKPKALNFALATARGSIIAVFDAEDHPSVDQLRLAAARFATAPAALACLQARLVIHNRGEGLLPRLFDVEYAVQFDALLPTYQDLGLPLPLGGTSNHFRREALDAVGGWDAYNVTEDADLGIRLRRAGYRVIMLASDTEEEAPASFGDWMRQRSRWMKGWLQTAAVHNRQPLRLLRELGLVGFLGFQVIIGGTLLSAYIHPVFWIVAGLAVADGRFMAAATSTLGHGIVLIAATNILLGYASAILLGVVASVRRGRYISAVAALFIPLYWLAVSFAAYRALWQLWRDPFRWEKTTHRPFGAMQPGRETRRIV